VLFKYNTIIQDACHFVGLLYNGSYSSRGSKSRARLSLASLNRMNEAATQVSPKALELAVAPVSPTRSWRQPF
jgi:hypothetical protein